MFHVCVIVEGAYPYVTGGVAQWLQQMMLELSDIEFSIVTISAEAKTEKDYKYELPSNVVRLSNLSLDDETLLKIRKKQRKINSKDKENAWRIIKDVYREMEDGKMEGFSQLYRIIGEEKILNGNDLILSKQAWQLIISFYESKVLVEPFIDFYWSWRTNCLLLYKLFLFELPKADIYHSLCTGYAGVLGAIAKAKYNAPFIMTEHGIYTHEREMEIEHVDWVKGYQKDVWTKMFVIMGKIAYFYSDKIISLYENAKKAQLELGASKEKTEVIPNGVNIDAFSAAKEPAGDGKICIGMVCRVVPIKDVLTFIYACKIIDFAFPQSEFYIIGSYDEDEDYYQRCKILIKELGLGSKVVFTGKVKMDEYYPLLDVLVITSIKESQPLTVLEAISRGIPVVATKVGSLPEILKDAGIIVLPKDIEAIAKGVIKFITDKPFKKRIVQKAFERVKEEYSFSKVVQRYRTIYTQIGG